MPKETVLVELYAGMAALSLWLFAKKPVLGRQGSKASYASAIAERLNLPRPDRIVLNDADADVASALRCLTDSRARITIASELERYASDSDRDYRLLRKLRNERLDDRVLDAARWLAACAGSAYRSINNGPSISPARIPKATDGLSRTFSPRLNVLAERVRTFPLDADFCQVRRGPAETLDPIPNSIVYLDPPYAATAGYEQVSLLRPRSIAERWARAGCSVGLSETNYSLGPLGWTCYDLTDLPGTRRDRQMIRVKNRRELLFVSP